MQTLTLVSVPIFIDELMDEVQAIVNENARQHTALVSYARDPETNAPFGTVVAVKKNGTVQIGWSMQRRPQFKKEFERQIALGRATKGTRSPVPDELDDTIELMAERAKKYFGVSDMRVIIAGVY